MEDFLTFLAGCAIGALSSWLITHRYYVMAGNEQKAELNKLSEELRSRNTLVDFERLVTDQAWTKTHVGHQEIWVCDTDNTYQIHVGDEGREFREPWTSVHPDAKGMAYPVHLMIAGATIKELTFVSLDGGRIFVPITETQTKPGGGVEYVWHSSSLPVKVCRIIGTYYRYDDLEGIAALSKVSVLP